MITDIEKRIALGRTLHHARKVELRMKQRGWDDRTMAVEIGKAECEVRWALNGDGNGEILSMIVAVCSRA